MLFTRALVALLPVVVAALPAPDAAPDLDVLHGEIQVFKRDSTLQARDVELADQHGVNLTEMYRHSLIKRDSGDDITVWVNRAFVEGDLEEDLVKRQRARPVQSGTWRPSMARDWCRDHHRVNHAGPNGPYSGGVQAMFRWADQNSGYFDFGDAAYSQNRGGWREFVIAGSNSGANAVYKARLQAKSPPNWNRRAVGTEDVRNDADWTQNRARSFSGSWRASSKGSQTCGWPGEGSRGVDYEIVRVNRNV